MLKAYSDECWKEAADADTERVPTYMVPDMSSYFE